MKTGLFLSLLFIGGALFLASCRTAAPAPSQFRSTPPAATKRVKDAKPFYAPIAPNPNFKVRRY